MSDKLLTEKYTKMKNDSFALRQKLREQHAMLVNLATLVDELTIEPLSYIIDDEITATFKWPKDDNEYPCHAYFVKKLDSEYGYKRYADLPLEFKAKYYKAINKFIEATIDQINCETIKASKIIG